MAPLRPEWESPFVTYGGSSHRPLYDSTLHYRFSLTSAESSPVQPHHEEHIRHPLAHLDRAGDGRAYLWVKTASPRPLLNAASACRLWLWSGLCNQSMLSAPSVQRQALRAVISLTCTTFRMPRFDGNAAATHRAPEGGWNWLKAVGNQNKNGFAGWGKKYCPMSRTFALGFDDRL